MSRIPLPLALIFAMVLLAPPLPAFAQTGSVSGTVRDAGGEPLPGVQIVLEDTGRGTVTDADGTFLLDRIQPGTYTVLASSIGFRRGRTSVTVAAGTNTDIALVLEEITLESDEIVVTALRRPEFTVLVPVSVSLLTREEIDARNVYTLDQALRYTSGVQMAENQVSVRGSSGFSYNVGSRVLLLVDGVPLLGPETGGVPFDAIPMPQVARIEVVKGPGSALYGSGALGGVVNIITRDFPEQPETSVRLFGGLHDPVRHEIWRRGWGRFGDQYRPLGGVSLTHARKAGSRGGGWLNLSYRRDFGYMQFNEDEVFQAYTKLGWVPSSHLRLNILGGVTARERDTFLYWDGVRDVLSAGNLDLLAPGAGEVTGANDNRSLQISILPTLHHNLSARLFHSLRLRYFAVQIRPIDLDGRTKPLAEGTTGFRLGGEWQLNWAAGREQYLTVGVSADANAARSEFFRTEDNGLVFGQPEFGAFAQYERSIGDRLSVLAGFRFDAYQIDSTTTASRVSPKLSAAWSVTPGTVIRASYGKGFRVPGIAERYIDNQDFFPFFPNYRLHPEISTGYEIGLRTGTARGVPGRVAVDVAVFWNDYESLVEPQFVTNAATSSAGNVGFQFVNLTRARIRGAELTTDLVLPGGATARAGYTLLDARDLTEDTPLAFRSRHLLKISADVPLPARLALGADFRLASRPERVDTDFARFVQDADVMVPIRVVDARLTYAWRTLSATVLVTNALDYYYVERPAYLAPPRQFALLLRADF